MEDDIDPFTSTMEEKDVQVQNDDMYDYNTNNNTTHNPSTIADVKQSVISNMENTHLLNTNT